MVGPGGSAAHPPPASAHLLPLALSRPNDALVQARALLAAGADPFDASVAHQTVGIVFRDYGDIRAAIRELRTAVRLARTAGFPDREVDALATLGGSLVLGGRTKQGLATLDAAVRRSSGVLAGRVLMRRAGILGVLGRHHDALDDLRRAVTALRRGGDRLWEARALNHRAFIHLSLGSTDRANVDIGRCEELFSEIGQELELAWARHNRGLIAFRSGDLPAALGYLDEAAQRYQELQAPTPDLAIDRCAVLLAAGLPREALTEADGAIRALDDVKGQPARKAELLLSAATSALGANDPRAALDRAQAAYRLFGLQQRPWWRAHARLLVLQARHAAGIGPGRLPREAAAAAARLDELGSMEAPRGYLLAGRTALALGRAVEADRYLAAASRMRRRGPALARATGWLAEALRAEAAGDPRRLLGACRRGLDVLDEHVLTLGASELRAQATAHGAELAAVAQRHALRAGTPRDLLAWSERWRAVALGVPPVRPPDDPELRANLAAMRDVTPRLQAARARKGHTAALERQQRRLEAAVRARTLRIRGHGGQGGQRFDVADLLDHLGGARLAQIVEVDGELHVLVCGGGRVRRFLAGPLEAAAREVALARFRLRRAAGGHQAFAHGVAVPLLEAAGRRLERALLGPASRHLGDGPVVVVPPGRLHAVPWHLLPSLRDRPVSVSPSASVWLRARKAAAPRRRDVVLVVGPGLAEGGAEVVELIGKYPDVTVLGGGTATTERVLAAMDGAWLVHVAAHGTFRADSPLFSSLRVDDGPLTVHDLERLRRPPYRMILASCDSGLLVPAGADELLGLTTSLVALGTVGIVASVVPVADAAATRLMLALHERLEGCGSLAEALRGACDDLGDDPVLTATGWSFIALGAG